MASFGSSMFSGMSPQAGASASGQNQMPMQPGQPTATPPSPPSEKDEGATGVVKGFAEVRQSLQKWAEFYPDVSKAVDECLKKLTDAMYKTAMQSDSKEGSQQGV